MGSACASSTPGDFATADGGHTATGSGGTNADGGTLTLLTGDGGAVVGGCDGGPSLGGGTITAAGGPNIVVHGQPIAVQLTASAGGTPITGTWTTSDTAVGSVAVTACSTPMGMSAAP